MALFGSLFNKLKNAATGDLGTFLIQGTNGLDRRRALAETDRLSGVRDQLTHDLDAAYAPQQTRRMMGPSPDDSQMPSTGPQVDQAELVRQALLRANAQGLDTGGAGNFVPQDAFQIINGGNGAYGVANRRTGQVEAGQLPNPLIDEKAAQLQAQIELYKAQMARLAAAGRLDDAKAKTGGFAPKAPARGRSPTKTLPPLPPGFVVGN